MKQTLRNGILILLAVLLLLPAGRVSRADSVVFGDADGDGELTPQDASSISRHLSRFRLLDAAALSRADYNGDGEVTELDASLILSSFMSSEFQVPVTKSFSMLLTSDMAGNAWDPLSTEDSPGCTAMNVAACVLSLREADPNLLLLDAGGSLLGSSIADEYPKRTEKAYGPITSLFLKMEYDAVLLGDEAMSYPSQTMRREVNPLIEKEIPVLGANLQKSDPTIFDPKGVLWNDLVPYVILEIPQGEEEDAERMRVAVIGMTEPDLCPSEDEILPVDPLDTYAALRKELKGTVDYTVLLYHGSTESDASKADSYSLRDMLKKTDSIDLVVCANVNTFSVRSERNYIGNEVPIVSLPGGTETVTRISVSLRENGRPAILVDAIDARSYTPDDSIRNMIRPYVSTITGMMDAVVCTVGERIEAYQPDALGSDDSMDLIHEMQIFAAEQWIEWEELDVPQTVLSIAYPYIHSPGFAEGPMYYRDLYRLETETPQYTLMLVRGEELRAWLSAYADTVLESEPIYSLYGLSYLLNTLNPDTPLGFLEYSSGLDVDDDEVFTLILAQMPGTENPLLPYLDESWMKYGDRVMADFTLPKPQRLAFAGENPVSDALTAYLETFETMKPERRSTWIVL